MSMCYLRFAPIYNSNILYTERCRCLRRQLTLNDFAYLLKTFLSDGFGIQFDGLLGAVRQVHNAPHGIYSVYIRDLIEMIFDQVKVTCVAVVVVLVVYVVVDLRQ